MTDLTTIDAAIATLQDERKTLLASQNAERLVALKAVPVTWVWNVTWLNGHTADIRKQWSQETRDAFAVLNAPSGLTDWTKPQGMCYTLTCDNHLCGFRGGHVVLNLGKDTWPNQQGRLLTDAQIASLRAGIVPDELKA